MPRPCANRLQLAGFDFEAQRGNGHGFPTVHHCPTKRRLPPGTATDVHQGIACAKMKLLNFSEGWGMAKYTAGRATCG